MTSNESSWQSKLGLKIYTKEWLPEGKPKAMIVLVHGLGEHSNRYNHVAEFFNKKGIGVVSFDLTGHGQSEGIRGHIESYDSVCDDIEHLVDTVLKKYKNVPLFLYGHSLGGALVLYYSMVKHSKINGVIATGPALAPAQPLPPLKFALAKMMNSILPTLTLDNGLYLPGLSRDEKVVQAYKDDPLVTRMASARMGMEIIYKGKLILEHPERFDTPLLLMQGTEDKLVDSKATAVFASKASNKFVIYKEWKGFFHELHNEPEKADVLGVELDWIKKQI